jgi:hypothetical protein
MKKVVRAEKSKTRQIDRAPIESALWFAVGNCPKIRLGTSVLERELPMAAGGQSRSSTPVCQANHPDLAGNEDWRGTSDHRRLGWH